MKVLVDEMHDGLEEKLVKLGYLAYSVRKLKNEQNNLGHDFNILEFAREDKMVLITADGENGKACRANNIPCIFINQDEIINKIIVPGLESLQSKTWH